MKLIGLIPLPLPKILTPLPRGDVYEIARHMAFDEDGRAWLLVERHQRYSVHNPGDTLRIDYVRWQLAEQLPQSLDPVTLLVEGQPKHREAL